MTPNQKFTPGYEIPHNGVYVATHSTSCACQHEKPHLVTGTQGINFPECNYCGKDVTFELKKKYPIGGDPSTPEATPMHDDDAFNHKFGNVKN